MGIRHLVTGEWLGVIFPMLHVVYNGVCFVRVFNCHDVRWARKQNNEQITLHENRDSGNDMVIGVIKTERDGEKHESVASILAIYDRCHASVTRM